MKIDVRQYISVLKQISAIAESTIEILFDLQEEHTKKTLELIIERENIKLDYDKLYKEFSERICNNSIDAKKAESDVNLKEPIEGTPRKRKYHLRKTTPEANPEPGVCLFCNGPPPSPERKFCSTSHQVKYAHQQNGHVIKEQPKQEDPPQTPYHSKN